MEKDISGRLSSPILTDAEYELLNQMRFYETFTWHELRTEIIRKEQLIMWFTEDSLVATKNKFEDKLIIERVESSTESYKVTRYGFILYGEEDAKRFQIQLDKALQDKVNISQVEANKSTITTNNTLIILSILTVFITSVSLALDLVELKSVQKIEIIEKKQPEQQKKPLLKEEENKTKELPLQKGHIHQQPDTIHVLTNPL